MPSKDTRIDAYIAKAQPFAQPILRHLRAVVHDACPDVQETIKWGMPFFEYHGTLCHLASFKAHASFGFWKGKLLLGAKTKNTEAMGDFGRITSLGDLPPKARIKALVKQAMQLNESGVKRVAYRPTAKKPAVRTPKDLSEALKKNTKAAAAFNAFSPSHRREYIEWITEAKTAPTRAKRLATTLEWLAEGKARNWKYMRS
jgi:hypothetical protein